MSRTPFRRLALALTTAALALATAPPAGHARQGPPAPTRKDGPAPAASSWKLKRTLRGHTGAVYSAAFFPGGERVATSGDDGMVRVWDVATGRLLRSRRGPGGTVSDVAVSP